MQSRTDTKSTEIFYARVDEFWRKEEKYNYLNSKEHYQNVEWQQITPDSRYTWLTEGLHAEFDTFIPMGTKEVKTGKLETISVLFEQYSLGVGTNRDAWVYNFNVNTLTENIQRTIEFYNAQVLKWLVTPEKSIVNIDNFVAYDNTKISWSSGLKQKLKGGQMAEFSGAKLRYSLYRPFTKPHLFFDRILNHRVFGFPSIFPTTETEDKNRVICVSGIGGKKPFHALIANMIPSLDFLEKTQCFPFYTYDEDGTNRQENITDWALTEFRTYYGDDTITKWDIFHYTYGLLHHPVYREKYEMNLKRDLPHIPYAEDFWGFANAGAELADLHVNYESVPKYDKLRNVETPGLPIDWRVEKMRLSKDKTQLKYNEFLTLDGIPRRLISIGSATVQRWSGWWISIASRRTNGAEL